jgi:hypothetical protein
MWSPSMMMLKYARLPYDGKESYHDPVKVAATISFEVVTNCEIVLEIYLIDNITIVQIFPYRTTSKLMPPDCFIIAVDGGKEHITLPFCKKFSSNYGVQ